MPPNVFAHLAAFLFLTGFILVLLAVWGWVLFARCFGELIRYSLRRLHFGRLEVLVNVFREANPPGG